MVEENFLFRKISILLQPRKSHNKSFATAKPFYHYGTRESQDSLSIKQKFRDQEQLSSQEKMKFTADANGLIIHCGFRNLPQNTWKCIVQWITIGFQHLTFSQAL